MKKVMLIVCLLSTFTATAKPMTCKCTKGSMVFIIDGDRFEMSCTGGGQVSCQL
jgi:hypothetical protein